MSEWIPIFVLPNVNLSKPTEVDGIAIMSTSDPRVGALSDKHPNFKTFISSFRTEFGRRAIPSIMMVRANAPSLYRRIDALASFRDALAISVITRTWAKIFRYGHGGFHGPQYANYFHLYPWTLDRDFGGITTRVMGLLGYESDVSLIRPQTTAGLSATTIEEDMIDVPLLAAILNRWQRRYSGKSPSWKDRALFRSITMANAAAMLGTTADTTHQDVGRHIAIWVSAFEILAHPKNSETGFKQVYELLENAEWKSHHHRDKIFSTYGGRKGRLDQILPCWIYGELNHARNDFIHGNPIRQNRLITKRSKRNLYFFAFPLYRMALTSFLDIRWKKKSSPVDILSALENRHDQSMFGSYQRDIEAGLATIKYTKRECDLLRTGKLDPRVLRRPY